MNVNVTKLGARWMLTILWCSCARLYAAEGSISAPITVPISVPITVPVAAPSRLQTLERKASEYEWYRARYQEVQKLLDDMLVLFSENEEEGAVTPKAGFGKLEMLLKKAEQSEMLARELAQVRAENERLLKQRDALRLEVESIKAEFAQKTQLIQTTEENYEKWKAKADGLRETIDRLLLGEFEYYEVKEGDSLQSIAANPMVYGDPSRAVWLRQVNTGWVKHLDNLPVGEVLIIPRFPRNGLYEF